MQRLPFVDWARGFAVVAMVLWHTGDAWLRPELHAGEGFFFLRFIGGLAAPSFLMLAGMAAGLGARPVADVSQASKQARSAMARGAEIVVLGYLLRLQTWLLDAAALTQLPTVRSWLPLGLGYAAILFGVRGAGERQPRGWRLVALGAALAALGLAQADDVAPGRLARLLQVDVLQAIGMSLVILALGERHLRLLQRPALSAGFGVAVAAATYSVSSALPGPLPAALAAYLGRFPPVPGTTVSAALFPLFPWLGYAFLGAGLGAALRLFPRHAERLLLAAVVCGAALSAALSEGHAYVQDVMRNPALIPPLRVAFRVGVVCVLLGLGFAYSPGRVAQALVTFGRASLRVYWFHLPFAYGLFGRPLKNALGFASWAAMAGLLLIAMWCLTLVRWPSKPAPKHS